MKIIKTSYLKNSIIHGIRNKLCSIKKQNQKKSTRQNRIDDFNLFYEKAEDIFLKFGGNDPRVNKFENYYMLSVCPGGRNGGNNVRIVEVFWGLKSLEILSQGSKWNTLFEYGTTLRFYRGDDGFVMIDMYPAGTENRKAIEDSISLKLLVDPKKLADIKFLKKCWNNFIAYMECTSIDGAPTCMQQLCIFKLRFFKHLVIDNKWSPTKFWIFMREILKWTLTVGLSGVIVYIVILMTQPKTTKTETQLDNVNKKLEYISNQLDTISINKTKTQENKQLKK